MSAAKAPAGKALVFGASGMIGSRIAAGFAAAGVDVVGLGGRPAAEIRPAATFPYVRTGRTAADARDAIASHAPFDRVVWAHGVNNNDSVYAYDRDAMRATFDANVVFVADTLHLLLAGGHVAPGSRFCVVSSIWQTIARQEKMSYAVSKAALQGLVASAAVDLARDGHLINAVLPGVLDTAMTRAMLSEAQLRRVAESTPFGRLPAMDDVVAAALFFCSDANRSVTGQFLAADLGLRTTRLL